MKKNLIVYFILAITSVFLLKALFHQGAYTAHDIWHNIARLIYYKDAVCFNAFPPYWISTLASGFGYPLFVFSYHLPWIIAIPITKLGFDAVDTTKILFFLSFFLSGCSMYLLANNLTRNKLASLFAALMYLWAPYRFVNIFVSAAMGISSAFIFLPLIFLGISLASEAKTKKSISILSLGLSGMILSHLPTLVICIPTIFLFFIYLFLNSNKKQKFITDCVFGAFLGIGISAFYLIPSLYYSKDIRGFGLIYQKGFVSLKQLIYSKWGYGIINESAVLESPFSFQVGIAQWIVVFISTVLLFTKRYRQKITIPLVLAFCVNIFLMLPASDSLWKAFDPIVKIDFPFRFLFPTVFITSCLSAFVLNMFPKKQKIIVFCFFITVAFYTNRNHLNVNMYIPKEDVKNFLAGERTTNSYDEYLPNGADGGLIYTKRDGIISGKEPENYFSSPTDISFDLVIQKGETLTFNLFYFPGINVYLNKNIINTKTTNGGLISLITPVGKNHIDIKYEKTKLITTSEYISIVSILVYASITLGLEKIYNKISNTKGRNILA